MNENQISRHVVDAAVKIHRALGPGLYESVYETILAYELQQRGLPVTRQVPLPLRFEGITFDEVYRADLVVDGKVIVELKSVEALLPIHRKQVLTYVKLGGLQLGILVNFGAEFVRQGIERIVNGLPDT